MSGPARLYPCLWYVRDAEAAARLYAGILPDSRIDAVTALPSDTPSGPAGSVVVVDAVLLGQRVQLFTGGPHHPFNDAMSLVVECDAQSELDRIWDAFLAAGGEPQQCGWLIDAWGVRWQIMPTRLGTLMRDPDRARARRVCDAMLRMVKLDIAQLEAAARGPG